MNDETVVTLRMSESEFDPSIDLKFGALDTLFISLYGDMSVDRKYNHQEFRISVTCETRGQAEQVHNIMKSVMASSVHNIMVTNTESLYIDCLQNAIDLVFPTINRVNSRGLAENWKAIQTEADSQYQNE